MEKLIKNDEVGKYLLVRSEDSEDSFEDNMIRALRNDNCLIPGVWYEEEKRYLRYCITGLRGLDEYLVNRQLSKEEIGSLLLQINGTIEILKNYMLRENNILISPDMVFVSEENKKLFFCIFKGEGNDFTKSLAETIERFIVHVNREDLSSCRLALSLFDTSRKPDFYMHEIMNDLRIIASNNDRENHNCMGTSRDYFSEKKFSSDYVENIYNSSDLENQYDTEGAFTDSFIEEIPAKSSVIKKCIIKMAISLGMMSIAFVAMTALKGISVAKKLIPFFLILAVCLTGYLIVEALKEKKKISIDNAEQLSVS